MVKRGIVLMNLGSPDTAAVKDVAKYLREFLMDERVIDSPYLLRLFLVKGIIVPFRAAKSAEAYKTIWWKEGSPLVTITKELRSVVQKNFEEPVEIAMRYGNPTPRDAYDNLLKRDPEINEVILFPLYPHYAMSSYETAVEYMKKVHARYRYNFTLCTIKPYYSNPDYIKALSEHIKPYLERYDHLLFSYHGIPERHIKKSDCTKQHCLLVDDCCSIDSPAHQQCYRHQCLKTTEMVAAYLQLPSNKFSYSFQSRLGRDPWLKPYTDFRLEEMPGEGIKNLLVVCPAFVSDCLETLEEIAIRGKESFLKAGGEVFEMIPCLNVDALWVHAMQNIIKKEAVSNKL